MPTVDFVYDKDCPNVRTARGNLMQAFTRTGISARWEEYQIGATDAPARVRGFGSPTILVDGVDVDGLSAGAEDCCRVYRGGGAPSIDLIVDALALAGQGDVPATEPPRNPPSRSQWKSTAAVLPGIGVALIPQVACPLCWPAYAGVISAAGLSFLMENRWLLPISALLLLAALAGLAWRAGSRRGYGPLGVGAASVIAVLAGKFALHSIAIVYVGAAALVVACVWNAWPQRVVEPSCSTCRSAVHE